MTVMKTAGYFFVSAFLVLSSLLKASKSNAQVKNSRFSKVISFGDSLSDSGNYVKLGGAIPLTTNHGGRVSNGPVWVERIFPNIPHENYAFIGAHTSGIYTPEGLTLRQNAALGLNHQFNLFRYAPHFMTENRSIKLQQFSMQVSDLEKKLNLVRVEQRKFVFNSSDWKSLDAERKEIQNKIRILEQEGMAFFQKEFPGCDLSKEVLEAVIQEDLDHLPLRNAPIAADPNALYTVWAGMNDLRKLDHLRRGGFDVTEDFALQTARNAVSNIDVFIKNLISSGAKYIVVANLPTIFYRKGSDKDEQERLVRFFNNQLHQNLVSLASQNKDITIIPIDVQTLGEELQADPQMYGLENARDYCQHRDKVARNPNTHLFWDEYGHLTAKGYELLARYVEEFLRAPYDVVPQMNATESAAISATKNVNQRLFALRGGSHPLSSFASSLVSANFNNVRSPGESDWAHVSMSSDGQGVALPELRKNRFVRRAHSPLHAPQRKANYLPSLNADVQDGKFGIFVSGDLHLGDQKTTDDTTGYRHHTQTVTWGGDYKFSDWFLSGIAMSYINANTKLKEQRGTIDVNGYALSLYDSLKWKKLYLDSVFTYGWNQNKIRRNVTYFNRSATGTPLGRHWSFGGLAGYDFSFSGFHFGPTVGLRYGEVRIDKYKEDGAGAFNLIIGRQKASSFVSSFGGHVGYKIKTDLVDITPQIRSSYDHEFKDRSRVIVTELASMPGIPFKVPVSNNDRNYGRVGGGLNFRFKNDLSISFDYETIFARRKARDHFVFGKVRFVF